MKRFAVLLAVPVLACASLYLSPDAPEWSPPGGPAPSRALVAREPCAQRDPLRMAWFGDLHVHTAFSMDASVRGLAAGPDAAYRFATGETVDLPPYDRAGRGTRRLRIDRPLDFAAVTDHAEWIGEVSLCTRSDSTTYDSASCRTFRGESASGVTGPTSLTARMLGIIEPGGRLEALCGPGALRCRAELLSAWRQTQAAAERWYDRTRECRFTSFHAWEYSYSPGLSKVHRNVILRNEIVPELPISSIDEPSPEGLWRKLRERCNDTGSGCEALVIPHNPNLSNGQMFAIPWREAALAEQRERAALRAEMEPLVEVMQIKGESECRNGMFGVLGDADELCDFEKARGLGQLAPEDCREGSGEGALAGRGCISRLDFVRYALLEGLRERARIGVNPYRFGFIGSTDTHNATPGATDERLYVGANGARDATLADRLDGAMGGTSLRPALRNPGGLMGAWAEENSRDALFDAMQRRETFATSGTRIVPRFFGGWSYPDALCERAELVERGYADGVPMGAELPPRPRGATAPVFLFTALRDPGSGTLPGTKLQRIQVIKGWVDDDGAFHQSVRDVAGAADNGATVDPATCEPRGPGFDTLCAVWRDPDFDPDRPAVYYARAVENPTCRWNSVECLATPAAERPAGCSDATLPRVVQERAWTSPIWYAPGRGMPGAQAQ